MDNHHDAQVAAFVTAINRCGGNGHADVQYAGKGEFIIDGVVNVRAALDAALVDVPAVEPAAWMIDLGDGETKITDNDIVRDRWHQTGRRVTNLYPAPPLSREGEDSAEVIEEGAKILAKWIVYAWDGLSDRDISAEYKDWAYNGIGALSMQGGKPALRKVAASILALAATRSGFAAEHRTHHEPGEFGEGATVRRLTE